jgi:hypothetical protein
MAEPVEEAHDPLFRDQAVAWAGGRRLGDLPRLETRATHRLFQLLVMALIALAAAGSLVRVPVNAEGTAVVDGKRGLVTALFAAPLDVHPGDSFSVYVGEATRPLLVKIASVSPAPNKQVEVTGHVPATTTALSLSGRAYIRTGSTSLLRFIVSPT